MFINLMLMIIVSVYFLRTISSNFHPASYHAIKSTIAQANNQSMEIEVSPAYAVG